MVESQKLYNYKVILEKKETSNSGNTKSMYPIVYEGDSFNVLDRSVEIDSVEQLSLEELKVKFKGTKGIASMSGDFKNEKDASNTEKIKD